MRFAWLKSRRTNYALYLTAYVLIILAVLVAANVLANRYNQSYDATSNKRYTLSDQTIKVVRNLKQDATINYYDRMSEFARAKDLLDRYDALSPKLTVAYIDPDRKPQLAKAAGVKNYGTIYVEAGGRREEAKSLTEEELTSALIRALKGAAHMVCAVTGSGEHDPDDQRGGGAAAFKQLLEKNNYKARSISLLEKAEVPGDCTVLVIDGPRLDYTEPVVKAVGSYVEKGGRALFMLDPPLRMGRTEIAANAGLAKLLESWGVTANNDMALDMSGVGQLFGLGPEMPLVTSYEQHPIVRELKGSATVFPVIRSLDVKSTDKTKVEKLFETNENSYATTDLSSAEIRIDPRKDKKGPLTLAAAGTYEGGKGPKGRFVVVGSSAWADNGVLSSRSFDNRDLAMNMVNWLSSDEDLISIRPKEPADRPLSMNQRQMGWVFYVCLVLMPLIAVAGGISVWWKRR
ncbi:MAG: GldG family protein [Bryobacteraceae bacterium]